MGPDSAAGAPFGPSDTVLVTGAAGFIGFHVCRRLLDEGRAVLGVDSLDPYYDVGLKRDRLRQLEGRPGFAFEAVDLSDPVASDTLFARARPPLAIHLAAQPGVRHSLVDPGAYGRGNLAGFLHVLEGCRRFGVRHLVYASSSSVYGANGTMPFRVSDAAAHPLSLYGATKRANELMAHSYSAIFGLPTTGLRFFTVYGPWGRPDMAVYLFTRAIAEGRPIELFNDGAMSRDFTYVDDIVDGVLRAAHRIPGPDPGWSAEKPDPSTSFAPFRLYNVGGDAPVPLRRVVSLIEDELGRSAIVRLRPMQPGEAIASWAEVGDLARDTGFRPSTPIEVGIRRFVAWFRDYHGA